MSRIFAKKYSQVQEVVLDYMEYVNMNIEETKTIRFCDCNIQQFWEWLESMKYKCKGYKVSIDRGLRTLKKM